MERQEIVKRFISCYNEFDLDGMLDLLTDDIVFENIIGGSTDVKTSGIAEFENLAGTSLNLFDERKQTITAMTDDGGGINVEIDFYGKIAEDLPNGLEKGDELKLKGRSEYKLKDGKICSITDIS
ncbi:MAG: nuclear transport factor 2 family protein [Deferribacterales bacterium]